MSEQPAPSGGEHEQALLDMARRASRQGTPALVLVLRLSAMPPPAPRPHHRRIAGAMLREVAQHHAGQMLAMGCGDLVLILPGVQGASGPQDAALLPEIFARLVRADAPDSERIVSVWRLPEAVGDVLAYATERAIEPAAAPVAEDARFPETDQICTIERLSGAAFGEGPADMLRRQTAVLLLPGKTGSVVPLFSELAFSMPSLEARAGLPGGARADPFLFRWLAGRLDQRLLGIIGDSLGEGGPLDATLRDAPPLHLNMSLQTAASSVFERLAEQCRAAGKGVGVEIALIEACGDPRRYHVVRDRLAASGVCLVLDNVSHLTAGLADVGGFAADLVKLDWSPRMAAPSGAEAALFEAALDRIGAGRVVLNHADTETAIRWGLGRGIRRYQGRHAEAMLAASRMAGCPWSGGCELRQCLERGTATTPAARQFCRNPDLLDRAAPPAAVEARAA